MVRVKICGLTNLADTQQAAVCGADLLGFIFVPESPRYIAPEQAAEIIAALRAEGCTAQMVGVVAHEPVAQVQAIAAVCSLDYVQLHGDYTSQEVQAIDRPVFVTHRVAGAIPWDKLTDCEAAAYLLDTYRSGALGGTGATWDWQALADAPPGLELILAGGLNPDNVAEALGAAATLGVAPWAVDVSSGVERCLGRKDHDKVRAFIRAARGASA